MKNTLSSQIAAITIVILIVCTACTKEPEVSFTPNKTAVKVNESVNFENTSETNKVYNFSWSFGDGSNANSYHTSYKYSQAGEYTVTLSGTNKKGNKNGTYSETIVVESDQLTGQWRLISGYSNLETDCQHLESSYSEISNEATQYNIEFFEGGNGAYTDENGNVNEIFIQQKGDNYTSINVRLPSNKGTNEYLFFNGLFNKQELDNTLRFTKVQTVDLNWGNPCTSITTDELFFERVN